jgi:transcriptional regulator NrdR family protein
MVACPKCGARLDVIETRETSAHQTRRRRRCVQCQAKFTTMEIFFIEESKFGRKGEVVIVLKRELEQLLALATKLLGQPPAQPEQASEPPTS